MKWQEYRNFTINQIRNAQVCWEPYWHAILKDTYHPELLQLCYDNWPEMSVETMRKNPANFNQNRLMYIPEQGDRVFWNEFFDTSMIQIYKVKNLYQNESVVVAKSIILVFMFDT